MTLALFLGLTCGTAALPLMHCGRKLIRECVAAIQWRRLAVAARARIVAVDRANEAGRRIPLARLRLEVFHGAEAVAAEAEGFYSSEESNPFQTGTVIWVKWNAATKKVVHVMRSEAQKVAIKEKSEGFISTRKDQVQIREAHHRRVAFR